ncbi:Protein prenyltransferase alpha subunit repeat-containing protein 1 [Linnemannia exigua]|uniref:Protein prenyltransferase alpha subunit repeat-containing protein 1 n=1 Tax=Linnemannia exigua TaxID=604196 RepID=A0AAD4HB76_9FUNG|nr:Protein prenyltransferase alpha subunit repeat-containing protein 1 [Linnemannia exigua]
MSAEARLANTSITQLDPSLTKDVLYNRLVEILNKSQIDEIGVLPFLPEPEHCQGKGEDYVQYPFVVQEQRTKLGIPIFCWVPILDAAYGVFKDAVKSSCSSSSSSQVAGGESVEWWQDPVRCKSVVESSACLMIFCPDSFMAANARKRLVQEGYQSAAEEIRFLDTILTFPRNCKSSGAWYHRKWLICFMHKDHRKVPLDPLTVEGQLKICQAAADRYPKCYYAWTLRHWLVEQLGVYWWKASLADYEASNSSQDQQERNGDYYFMPLEREFERMKSHMQRNVSDHSGQQHLQQCMVQLSGQWIVQRKIQDSITDSEVVLQWTREELSSRRQRRMTTDTRLRWRKRRMQREVSQEEKKDTEKDMVQNKKAQQKEMREDQPRSYRSAIRSQVQDPSTLMVVPFFDQERALSLALARASFPWVVQLWFSELERTRYMVRAYPGHESLWYHLRFVYYGVCWLDSESELLFGLDGDSKEQAKEWEQGDGADDEEDGGAEGDEWFVSLASEKAFVKDLLAGIGLEVVQRSLAEKYLAWVERLDIGHQEEMEKEDDENQ